jgi:hypothetical protein
MSKKILVLVCCLLLLSAAACKKKQEQPIPQPGMPGQQPMMPGQQPMMPGQPEMPGQPAPQPGTPGQQPMMPGQPGMPGQQRRIIMPQGETSVVVPDSVKGKWKAVVLVVQDKTTQKADEYTVNLNSNFKVPNTGIKITVGEFLPDFRMEGLSLTSVSNEPNNPAVAIRVSEGGKQIFPGNGKKWGWLYMKFPTMHPFEHPKYAVFLKEGVKKG